MYFLVLCRVLFGVVSCTFWCCVVYFLVLCRVLFGVVLVHLSSWLSHSCLPKYLKYLKVFRSIYSAREACVCVLTRDNRKRPWGDPLPKPHIKPRSLRSLKRCGCATFNSGYACAPLACPSALRLRGSEEPQLKLRQGYRHSPTKARCLNLINH
ncbi:hypothetical protein EFP22_08335 [Lacticaseibacillus paracasei]|nr:hypothetical protein [Lacticaseibacillus paracasei]